MHTQRPDVGARETVTVRYWAGARAAAGVDGEARPGRADRRRADGPAARGAPRSGRRPAGLHGARRRPRERSRRRPSPRVRSSRSCPPSPADDGRMPRVDDRRTELTPEEERRSPRPAPPAGPGVTPSCASRSSPRSRRCRGPWPSSRRSSSPPSSGSPSSPTPSSSRPASPGPASSSRGAGPTCTARRAGSAPRWRSGRSRSSPRPAAGPAPRRAVPALVPVAVIAGLAVMFVHQMVRTDGRPRLTESIAVTVLRHRGGRPGHGVGAAHPQRGAPPTSPSSRSRRSRPSLADLVAGLPRVRPWMLPLSMLLGAAAALLAAALLGGPDTGPAALTGFLMRRGRARGAPRPQRAAGRRVVPRPARVARRRACSSPGSSSTCSRSPSSAERPAGPTGRGAGRPRRQ